MYLFNVNGSYCFIRKLQECQSQKSSPVWLALDEIQVMNTFIGNSLKCFLEIIKISGLVFSSWYKQKHTDL